MYLAVCMYVVVEFILLFCVLLMNTIFQHEASPLVPKLQTLLLRLMATGLGTLGLQVADALLFCVGDIQMSNVYTNDTCTTVSVGYARYHSSSQKHNPDSASQHLCSCLTPSLPPP